MFVYYTRKPEDVKIFKEFQSNKKDLVEEYNGKRSDYDKTLEKYSCLLKKLDTFPKDSVEHKALIVDLETLANKLNNTTKTVVSDIPVVVDVVDKPVVVDEIPKKKRAAKKTIKVDLE